VTSNSSQPGLSRILWPLIVTDPRSLFIPARVYLQARDQGSGRRGSKYFYHRYLSGFLYRSDPRSNSRVWFLIGRIRVRCSPRPLDQGSVPPVLQGRGQCYFRLIPDPAGIPLNLWAPDQGSVLVVS